MPAAFDAVLTPLTAALEACGARGPFASVVWGRPDPDDGQWLDLDGFSTAEGAAPALERQAPAVAAANLAGHWVFQNVTGTPLLAAGYLFASQQRVPRLHGNTLIHNTQWLQHLRFLRPELSVLPDDPLAGLDGVTVVADAETLTTTLFDEVEETFAPIVQAFRARRQTSTPNAWASVVDGLLQGFLLAARSGIGLDAAWALWQATIRSWGVGTRRWPRRLQFSEAGYEDEVVVRAACCLIYTTPDASGAKTPNCPNCPLDIGDAGRVRWMVDWLNYLENQATTTEVADPTA